MLTFSISEYTVHENVLNKVDTVMILARHTSLFSRSLFYTKLNRAGFFQE